MNSIFCLLFSINQIEAKSRIFSGKGIPLVSVSVSDSVFLLLLLLLLLLFFSHGKSYPFAKMTDDD
jgi:hypothetical protein